jgi:hypothetical protein
MKLEEKKIDEEINRLLKDDANKVAQLKKSYGNVSDFWAALSGGRFYEKPELTNYVVYGGHTQEYYREKPQRNVEIFTHLQVVNMHTPKLYQAMKKDYPEIVTAHEKIMAKAQAKFAETSGQASFLPKEIKKAME